MNTLTVPTAGRRFHIPCLDGIRAVALLTVFIAHAGFGQIIPGGFGVTIFFFLSGYLITTLLRIEGEETGTISLRDFYIRRAFRILPPLYLTLAVTLGLGLAGLMRSTGSPAGFLAAAFYFCNYYGLAHHAFNLPDGMEVIWSLTVEEHFYFIFPFVYLLFIRKRLSIAAQSKAIVAACVVALVWRTILVFLLKTPLDASHPWTYIATDCRFDSIAWGCLLAIRNNPHFADPAPRLKRCKGWFAIGGLALLLASFLFRNPAYRESLRYTQQGIALYPIFYYCVSASRQWAVRWLEWRPLRWVGWVSYALYLIHFAIIREVSTFLHNYPLIAVVSLALTLGYGWAMRETVELRLRSLRDRFISELGVKAAALGVAG